MTPQEEGVEVEGHVVSGEAEEVVEEVTEKTQMQRQSLTMKQIFQCSSK